MSDHSSPALGDTLERAIGATAVIGLRRDASYFDALIDTGALDARFAETDPSSSADPVGSIRELGVALGAAFDRDPMLVGSLGIDALALLRSDAVGPAGRMVSAQRRQRVVAVVILDPADAPVPVIDVVRARGGSLTRRLGGVYQVAFDDGELAVRALLDLRDATPSVGGLCAGAEAGDVISPGSDLFGSVVVDAYRIGSVAGTGEILVAPSVRDPLGELEGITFGFVAPRETEGGDPVAAWSVSRSR